MAVQNDTWGPDDLENPRSINVNLRTVNNVSDWGFAKSVSAPNEVGRYRLSVTFTLPDEGNAEGFDRWGLRLLNGSPNAGEDVIWSDVNIVEGPVALPVGYFDEGYSPVEWLVPESRPGGGSRLVGQRVAGLTASGGAVVAGSDGGALLVNTSGGPMSVVVDGMDHFSYGVIRSGESTVELDPHDVIVGPGVLGQVLRVDELLITGDEYEGPPFSGDTPNEGATGEMGWAYSWLGTPGRSRSMRLWRLLQNVILEALDGDGAPSVGIRVEGLAPDETSRVAIYRQTPGRDRTLVQGLGDVGVDGAGYWVDYLPPLGVPVTYVVEVLEGDPLEDNEATITIPSSAAWLQDALNPLLAVEVACRPGNRDTLFFTAEAFTA
ncbi:MAG TPA: hypothetical protein VK054_02130, partial [Beutenbergiaceae bacterium]|nr:hypothetical protein [Beutenbergiaceae bacterium]